MDVLRLLLAALICSGTVFAWYDAFYGDTYPSFGLRTLYNISAAREHANVSKSVSFAAGTPELWNFSVTLVEIPARGRNATEVNDPRVLLTIYDVHPPANWTGHQNSGLTMPVQYPHAPLTYQFTWRATYWPFSTSATNAYNGDGDCAGVINPTCLRQMSALNESSAVSTLDTPDCGNVTARWGGEADSILAQRSSLDDTWVWQLGGFISDVYSAGNRTSFERELQRIHLVALSGNDTRVLCTRIDESKVSADDPGTDPAPNGTASLVCAALWTVTASTVLGLLL